MTLTLVRKLLRDLRVPLLVWMVFLGGFECLWYKVAQRFTAQLAPFFMAVAQSQGVSRQELRDQLFSGPSRVFQTLIGGESINFERAMDSLSIGYVHPLLLTLMCIWAIGRGAGSLAGEIDKGTMELLLAQPIARWRVVLAHFLVDLIVIPLLCLSLWGGTLLGQALFGPFVVDVTGLKAILPLFKFEAKPENLAVDVAAFAPVLWNVGALLFAIGGYTVFLSACGRFRNRVLALAVLVTLLQFLMNLIGQLVESAAFLRPFSVFYYYQPQPIILNLAGKWTVDPGAVWGGAPLVSLNVVAVLLSVGALGYGLALWTFTRRDLPAPL